MKTFIYFIFILVAFHNFGQCPNPVFPDDLERLPNRLKTKYADQFPNLTFLNADGHSAHFFSILSPGKFQIGSESLQAKLKSFDFDYEHVATKECLYENFEIPNIFPTHIIIGKDGKLNDVFFGADIKRLEGAIKASL